MRVSKLKRTPIYLHATVVVILLFAARASGQSSSPREGSTAPQPGLTTSRGSDSQPRRAGSSAGGTQSGASKSGESVQQGRIGQDGSAGGGSERTDRSRSTTAPADQQPTARESTKDSFSVVAGDRGLSSAERGNELQLAQCLIIDNESEVALSEIGRQRARHPAVKEFAEQMIREHKAMLIKLRPSAGPDYNSRPNATHPDSNIPPASTTDSDTTLSRTGLPDAASANAGGISGGGRALSPSELTGGLDLTSIKREIDAQSLASMRNELSGKQGPEFDVCFMELQLAAHRKAVDTLIVFRKHADGNLR